MEIILAFLLFCAVAFVPRRTKKSDGKINLLNNVLDHQKKATQTTTEVFREELQTLVSRANARLRKRRGDTTTEDSSGVGDRDRKK